VSRRAPLALALVAACGGRAAAPAPTTTTPSHAPPPAESGALLAPSAFASIAEPAARSRAIFVEIGRVLLHPRCANCHPGDDVPHQGDAHEPHEPPLVAGATLGVPAMRCGTCHQDRNAELARVPGAPGWKLAPASMAWLGRSLSDVCAQLIDPARNGRRTLAAVRDHVAHDALVAWGWAPGADRAPAPGSQRELADLFQAWIDTGAACP
jgi:hypothetical protein